MKYETFKVLIDSCKNQLAADIKRDAELAKVLGGDTSVCTVNELIDNVIAAIRYEYPDNGVAVEQYIFEDSCDVIVVNGNQYDDTVENLWLLLEGRLY